jgi:hypothetical protein
MTETHTGPADDETEPEDALRRHPEGTAEGGDPVGAVADDDTSGEVPREHSEDPAEG